MGPIEDTMGQRIAVVGATLALCLAWAIVEQAKPREVPTDVSVAVSTTLPPVGTDSSRNPAPFVPDFPDTPLGAEALDCVIEPDRVVELGAPVPGVLSSLYVTRGEPVEAGEVIAELESSVEWAQVAVAKARAQTTGEVRTREAQLELEQRQNERSGEMFAGRAISVDARDQAETDVKLAELELELARDRRRIAQLELQRAYADANRRRLTSPIDGVVVEQLKFEGERVGDAPIVKIVRLDPLRVRVVVPSHLYGSLKPGASAEIEAEAPLRRRLRATIDVVDPIIDATSDTFNVELTLANPDLAIPSGLHCRAQFGAGRDLARN